MDEEPSVSPDPSPPDDLEGNFPEAWKAVVTDPRSFFERLRPDGGLQDPLVFAAITIGIGALGYFVFGGGFRGMIGFFLLSLAGLAVGAAIVMLVAQSVFEGQGDYEATFRALAYATAPMALVGLPVVKYLAALYGLYLSILAVSRAHGFDSVRSVLTIVGAKIVSTVLAYGLGLLGLALRVNPLWG